MLLRYVVFLTASAAGAEQVTLPGLDKSVEILRDRWGVPHIYAQTSHDLFFAQGWITARDRLFQIDLWRRIGTGKLAEVLGPAAVTRDRIARLVRFRGDWNEEWAGYSPDAKDIASAFTAGINAHIKGLGGARPVEFRVAGYDPGPWDARDVAARIAGLLMTRNLAIEVSRALDVKHFGMDEVQRFRPPDPLFKLELPRGLDLADLSAAILRDYTEAIGAVRIGDEGSNNWVVDGTRTVTGKPLLANDPHRPVQIPSLRKAVHLVGPGWNAIGSGEPALPGIALGHNEHIGFGFTIVGIDQGDLYVEKLNPAKPDEYLYRGGWKPMTVEREAVLVKGETSPRTVELKYTVHGPVIYEDRARSRAYALKWVGAEPGGAGYMGALSLARAKNWNEFRVAAGRYKVPSENLVYADRGGNIGWIAAGFSPIRKNWRGLFPVPGDSGQYEWQGFLPVEEKPQLYNPASHYVVTANHNILPRGYRHQLAFDWALPFRYERADEMLRENRKFSVQDFQVMQQDVTSIPARRFQAALKKWKPRDAADAEWVRQILAWDARLTVDSTPALLFELWTAALPDRIGRTAMAKNMNLGILLATLEAGIPAAAWEDSLRAAVHEAERLLGKNRAQWRWGKLHTISFRHAAGHSEFDLGPVGRPGDANTVNATSGTRFRQTNGASYRHILDLSDWDKSVWSNTPGESGDPKSPHYRDLLDEWASGGYHPMPYSRGAVEKAAVERIQLVPGKR
jgi:penicillin amidase